MECLRELLRPAPLARVMWMALRINAESGKTCMDSQQFHAENEEYVQLVQQHAG